MQFTKKFCMLGPDQRSHSDQSPSAWPAVAAAGREIYKLQKKRSPTGFGKRRRGVLAHCRAGNYRQIKIQKGEAAVTELEMQIIIAMRRLTSENTVKALAYLSEMLEMPGTSAADPQRDGGAA